METLQPPLISTAAHTPACGENATPFSQQTVVLTKQDYIALKWEANYWRAQHEQSLKREAALKAQVTAHEATIRDLKQRLYGKKSEKSAGPERADKSKRRVPANGVNSLIVRATAAVIVPPYRW